MNVHKLVKGHFAGINTKDINNYIETVNEYLNEKLPKSISWPTAAATLRRYLNEHDFINNEGDKINDGTIDEFITRINSENKINDLNFLPNNKLVNEMNQQQVNPLQQLVQGTITVQDLLNIYNKYAPQALSMEEVRQASNDSEDTAKAYLINQILSHARDGTLVTKRQKFGKPLERKGMPDLANIVLGLQRDIQRVKKAISPRGAEAIVNSHNATAKPSAHWKLNKRNPEAPASLANLTDYNNDGVPDVVITNASNQPLFVNGYTTTNSTYPIDLAYYNQYPTRADRRGHPLNEFKKDLYNVKYVEQSDDFRKVGDVLSSEPRLDYLSGYELNTYHLPPPKRMSSFNRFKKFVLPQYINSVLDQFHVPPAGRLALSSKAAAHAWNQFILNPIFEKYNAQTAADQNKIKKKQAAEIDERVNNFYYSLHQTSENWSEDQRSGLEQNLVAILREAIGEDYEGAQFL